MKAQKILEHFKLFCGAQLHNEINDALKELEELEKAMKPKSCEVHQSNGTQLTHIPKMIWHNGHYYKLMEEQL